MKRSFGNMRLGGRYRLSDRIAFGGMGEVWRALDEVLGRKVAVKILRPELAYDDSFRRRFRAEARTAGALSHPGIAAVYDYGEGPVVPADSPLEMDTSTPGNGLSGDEVAYLVMELVPGEPLSTMLSRGALGVDQTLDIVAQTARALHAAHERQVVHRDVKPANLLVTPDGVVKVTDFGIARPKDHEPLTMTGQVMGTAHYLAPELARGREASPLSDVYALGVVMYECLAGRRPFEGDNQVAVATAHLAEPPPPLPDVLPGEVRELVDLAMEKDPAHRISSAADFARELEVVLRRRKRPNRHGGGTAVREIDLRDKDGSPSGAGVGTGVIEAGATAGAGGAVAGWGHSATTPADDVFPTGYDHGSGPSFASGTGYDYGQSGYPQDYGTNGYAGQNGYGQNGYQNGTYDGYGDPDATAQYGQPGYPGGPNGPHTPSEDLGLGAGSHRARNEHKVVPFELNPRTIGIMAAVAAVVIGIIAMAVILTRGPATTDTPPGVTTSESPSVPATSPGPQTLISDLPTTPTSTPTRTGSRKSTKSTSKTTSKPATSTTPTTPPTKTGPTSSPPTSTPPTSTPPTSTSPATSPSTGTATATDPGGGAGAGNAGASSLPVVVVP